KWRLFSLGVDHTLIDSLDPALEADYIVNRMLMTELDGIDVHSHPLASWLLPHTVSEMLAWPLTGAVPYSIAGALHKSTRRGPVPGGPVLSLPERGRFFQNLTA